MAYNVLLVDDSVTVRAVMTKTLKIAQIPLGELFTAGNGKEALDVLKEKWVDLVITDLNMPEMTGFELVDAMFVHEQYKAIPVIVVTTEGSTTRIDDLKKKGVRGYVRKPFTPEQIGEMITQVMGA
ncbi:MAG: response regulator [Spirochaetota bacterium]|nr:response regulator [Spirochaetota bacterium]